MIHTIIQVLMETEFCSDILHYNILLQCEVQYLNLTTRQQVVLFLYQAVYSFMLKNVCLYRECTGTSQQATCWMRVASCEDPSHVICICHRCLLLSLCSVWLKTWLKLSDLMEKWWDGWGTRQSEWTLQREV